MDRGAWWATVHGVVKSRTELKDYTYTIFMGEGPGKEGPWGKHVACFPE